MRELREHIRGTLGEIRKIIFDLRPMALDDLGLGPTIRGVLDNIRSQHGIFTEMSITGKEQRLESYIEIGLFRVVQEALNNVIKHAIASTIRVRIEFAPAGVAIVVEDDGKGFDDLAGEIPGAFWSDGLAERLRCLRKLDDQIMPSRSRVLIQAPLNE